MRLFAAIPVPSSAHQAIEKAAETLKDALGVKVLPAGNWHITLLFLGEVGEKRVEEIEKALAKIEFAPFTVKLDSRGAYPNPHYPRAIWLGGNSPEAEELSKKVADALVPLGFARDKFSVHVTVARSKSVGDIEMFLKGEGEICEFRVEKFVLMKSVLMPHGAEYDVIKEFPAKQH